MDNIIESNYNQEKNIWDIALIGEFDIFNSSELKTTINALIEEKQIDLTVDGSRLLYLDSTAIGTLVSLLKQVQEYNGNITLTHFKPNLLKLFKITNLDKIFKIEGESNE